jgi:O-antigen/teichoic acid export membrane protein
METRPLLGAMTGDAAALSLGRRLVRGGSWALLGKLVGLPLGLVTTVLLARLLDPAALGAYFLAMSLVALAAILAQGGLSRPMVKLVAAARATGQPEAARHAIKVAFVATGLGALTLALLLGLGPGARLASLVEDGGRLAGVIPIIALIVIAFALIDLAAETLRGFQDFRSASLLTDALSQRLLAACGFALLFLVTDTATLGAVLTVTLGASLLVAVFAGGLLVRRVSALARTGRPWRVSEVLAHGPPFMVVRLNLWLLAGADLWALGFFRPADEVALYGAAARFAMLVGVPLVICNAVIAPLMAELYAQARAARLEDSARAGATLSLLPALAAAVLFWLFGAPLLGVLLGDPFRAAAPLLAVLALGHVARVACGSCAIALTMTGHQRDVMLIGILMSLATILAYAVVTPAYGAFGLACATAASMIVHNGVMTLMVKRRLGLWTLAAPTPSRLLDLRGALQRAIRRG